VQPDMVSRRRRNLVIQDRAVERSRSSRARRTAEERSRAPSLE
jgi:hypothetical protein